MPSPCPPVPVPEKPLIEPVAFAVSGVKAAFPNGEPFTVSAAAATVLAMFYGRDNLPFTTGSDFMPGVFRSFDGFSAAAAEAASSRVYGGIHFRFASDDGLAAGLSIGQWTFTNYLQPTGNHSHR